MSSVYVPTPVALGSITLPGDGDARNASSVNVPVSAVADGVAFLGSTVADLAALSALLAPTDGAVRHVIGFGWYVFKTAVTTGLYPFAVPPVDATPGRWVSSTNHQTTLTRQVPVGSRVRGITNGGSGSTPGPDVINSTAINFIPVIGADGIFSTSGIFASSRVNTGASTNYAFLVDINDTMVDGATLSTAKIRFRPSGHAGLPARQPQLAIVRGTFAGTGLGTVSNLLTTGNGFAVLTAANLAAYDAAQALVFTPDQNNVVDKSTYYYFAIITDEAGTNAGAGGLGILGTTYTAIELSFTAIPDARRS